MASASQVFGNSRQTQPSTNLSAAVNGSRVALPRRSTMIYCRSTRISASSAARDRNRSTMSSNTSLMRSDIRHSVARFSTSRQPDSIYDRDRISRLQFSVRQRLSNVASCIGKELGNWTKRAVFQGDNTDRQACKRQLDGQDFDL